jgi:hypothetical protein
MSGESPGWCETACEDVGVTESVGICAVCHRSRARGHRTAAGDVFICTQCQADAAQFIAIQDSIIEEAPQFDEARRNSVDEQHPPGVTGVSRETWLVQLRMAGNDASAVARFLSGGLPYDVLQHAGQAVLRCSSSSGLVAIATTLIEPLSQRDWSGDPELIVELEHVRNRTTSELMLLAVDLEEIGEALDQSSASVSYIDLTDGTVWPGELFDVDQGPEDFDADDSDRWLPVMGVGSKIAYAMMKRFIATIDSPGLAAKLQAETNGSGAFRRFQAVLSRYEDEYTRWHQFRDDDRLGRARAWLADHGYRSTR